MNKSISLTLLFFAAILSSQRASAQASPDDMVKKFFTQFTQEGSSKALDNLYATSDWITKAGSSIQTLKIKIEEQLSEDAMGKYNGYELITKRSLGQSYMIASYMVKFDRQPIRFTFQFYKPKDKWSIYSFEYDGNLSGEMEEAIKVTYLTSDAQEK